MFSSRLQRVVFEDHGDPARPRVWPCFAVVPVAMVLYTLFAGVYSMFAFDGFYYSNDPAWGYGGWKLLVAYAGTITVLCLGVLIAAVVPARLSRIPMKERLLLTRPGMGPLRLGVIALGSIFVSLVASYILWMAYLILPEFLWSTEAAWDPYGYGKNSVVGAIVLAFATGAAPGIAEEILFRGYIQSRLLRRWSAPVAIGVSSVLFGIYHWNVEQLITTTFMGLWLGVLAWRTGSVWPGVAAHFAINVYASFSQWAGYEFDWSESDYTFLSLITGIVTFGFFYLSIRTVIAHKGTRWRAEPEAAPPPAPLTLAESVARSLETEAWMLPHMAGLLADLDSLGCNADSAIAMVGAADESPGRAMDLGCGKGVLSIALAERGWRCDGVDGHEPFVDAARLMAEQRGVTDRCRFVVGDFRDGFDDDAVDGGVYDLVSLCAVGPFAGGHARTIGMVRAMVRPGGLILIDDGFISQSAGSEAGELIGYARHGATLAQLTSHSDEIIDERIFMEEDTRLVNEAMSAKVVRRAEALITARPDLETHIRGYLDEQARQYRMLDGALISAMWLLRRAE